MLKNKLILKAVILWILICVVLSPSHKKSFDWNPFAIFDSPIGTTIARIITDNADHAFHYGIPYPISSPPNNFLGTWIAHLNEIYVPQIRTSPPSELEARAAMEHAESLLRLAFYMSPRYFPAYTVYFGFLTEPPNGPDNGAWRGMVDNDDDFHDVPKESGLKTLYQSNSGRLTRAYQITKKAIESYDITNPSEALAAASAQYNEYYLLDQGYALRPTEFASRRRELLIEASQGIRKAIEMADKDVENYKKSGAWSKIPEEYKKDFSTDYKLIDRICRDLEERAVNSCHKLEQS
jgi:hypothetical protein